MKKTIAVALLVFMTLCIPGCANDNKGAANAGSDAPPSGSSQSSAESIPKSDSTPEAPGPESSITISMVNLSNSIAAFQMKEKDTAYGWTLTEIEPFEMPSTEMLNTFYGVLTFTGEVEVTGTITHVNAIYDGFEFTPDQESEEKILIPDGREAKNSFFRISNDTDDFVAQSLSPLAIGESGTYTVTVTQYTLPYVPMMAVNGITVSSIEKNDG